MGGREGGREKEFGGRELGRSNEMARGSDDVGRVGAGVEEGREA